jgi:tetratricopeptide (TPR) repeat protein
VRREIVALTAGAPEDLAALATSLGMNGQYDESYRLFESLTGTEQGHDPYFLLNAGQTALMLQKEGPGTAWLRAASRFPGFAEDAYLILARYQLSFPRFDEGLRVLSEGLLRVPDSVPLLHLRARARRATGDETGAIEDWQHVLRLDPSDEVARTAIAEPPRREP